LINDKYLKIQVVAEILSCIDQHIYNLIVEGELEAIKVGARAMRVSEQSLLAFIERRKISPEDLLDPDQETKQSPADQRVARSKWVDK
jgi:excisionase family DNA binding protein